VTSSVRLTHRASRSARTTSAVDIRLVTIRMTNPATMSVGLSNAGDHHRPVAGAVRICEFTRMASCFFPARIGVASFNPRYSMIPKSGCRFSEKDHAQT
jgi:hypothetical protein